MKRTLLCLLVLGGLLPGWSSGQEPAQPVTSDWPVSSDWPITRDGPFARDRSLGDAWSLADSRLRGKLRRTSLLEKCGSGATCNHARR